MEIAMRRIEKNTKNVQQALFSAARTCPMTGQHTKREEGSTFTIPDGQATWWRCSACGGWHASIIGSDDNLL